MYCTTKVCKRCKCEKPITEFNRDKNRPDGRYPWCKYCHRETNREYYSKMKARDEIDIPETKRCARCGIVKPSSEFYRDNRRKDGLYSACKECHYKRTEKWRTANREVALEISRRSKQRHRDVVNAKARERYWANREIMLERHRRWKRENPEKNRELTRRYVARKLQATVEPVDYEAIIKRDGMRCHICGKKIRSRKDLHFDHIVPLSKGGEHSMKNVACAHAKCNLQKGDGRIPSQLRLAGDW